MLGRLSPVPYPVSPCTSLITRFLVRDIAQTAMFQAKKRKVENEYEKSDTEALTRPSSGVRKKIPAAVRTKNIVVKSVIICSSTGIPCRCLLALSAQGSGPRDWVIPVIPYGAHMPCTAGSSLQCLLARRRKGEKKT